MARLGRSSFTLRAVRSQRKPHREGLSFAGYAQVCRKRKSSSSIESWTHEGGRIIHPARWVAATRWATDVRNGDPTTILWDPPVKYPPFDEEEATRHRVAMTRAWLNRIAPGMGWTDADDLLSREREREALLVGAEPGSIPESSDWDPFEMNTMAISLKPRSAGRLCRPRAQGDEK